MSDSPGATPVAGSTRASTSVPVTLAPGYESCAIEIVRSTAGESPFLEVLLDGENEFGFGVGPGRTSHNIGADLSAGGEVAVRLSYTAGPDPGPSSGVWIEEIDLHCTAKPGEAEGYRFAEGTSMAAPQVTGAAALLFSLKPSASVTEVRQGLLGSVDPVPSLTGKTTSGGRLDAGAATDLFDSTPPPPPSLSATNPPSPAENNQPRLIGSAERGTKVDVYADADCSGSPVAGGSAAQLASPGIAITVGDGTTTELSVSATDLAPLTSTCSAPISYTESTDVVPPSPPQLERTDPASPGVSGAPRILGAAEAGSTVRVYAGASCAGSAVATESAAALGSPGIAVQVAEGVTAAFSATATDASDNTSACSAPISYTHTKGYLPPPPPPPPPACIVPKLVGKTLQQAKAALTRAACKLGTVRKPLPRKGRRPPALVVKSSAPAMGASVVGGKVNITLGPKPRKAHR